MIDDIRDEHDEEYIDELHKERGEMKEARKKQIKAQMDNERDMGFLYLMAIILLG